LNTGNITEAIDYLSKFKSDDIILSSFGKGAIEMLMQKSNVRRGFRKLRKAVETNKKDFTTPRFLLKAEKTALVLGERGCIKIFT
jgi:hypothetical protein